VASRTSSSRARRSRNGSLVVVGTGYAAVTHATLEVVALMQRADQLFYLVTDRLTEVWLTQLNASAQTLADLYGEDIPRQRTYQAMITRITAAVRRGRNVCVAFYGHPGVLVEASHQSIEALRREGYSARMAPAISADGCLYADLGVDPGMCGTQSFEATDYLLFRRRSDPTSILLLWQVAALGVTTAGRAANPNDRLAALTQRLRQDYPARHPVVLYQAAQRPGDQASIRALELRALPATDVRPLEMLYVPPVRQRRPDARIQKWLKEPAHTGH
jgi:uncharacterized protein YabN with tetrapyrrole methylase and pyrophosphatase domain